MAAYNFESLREHVGHAIACVRYAVKDCTADAPDNVAVECETCGVVLLDFSAPDLDLAARRDRVFQSVRKRFSAEDLDEHVHEAKTQEAADINNGDVDSQLAYLESVGGLDWLEELLT